MVSYGELVDALGGQAAFLKQLGLESDDVDAKRADFFRDVEFMRRKFGDMYSYLINPNSVYVQYWDLTTSMALLFTTFVTPFEVGLDFETKVDGLFVINQIVNTVFICDIVIQFFLPVLDKQGNYIREHKRLAIRYAKGWLFMDCLSVAPFDILDWQALRSRRPYTGTLV